MQPSEILSALGRMMSEAHQLNRSMEDAEEITDGEALVLSGLPVEQFAAQLEQLRERRRRDKMGGLFDKLYSPTASLGTMDKPRERGRQEEEYLDDTIALLGQEGTKALKRFQAQGEVADLETAFEKFGQAVDLAPDGHHYKPSCLNYLGISHAMRFKRLRNMADIDKAIECQVSSVDLTPDGHHYKPGFLNNLGLSHEERFERLGEMADIDKAIEYQVRAGNLTPDGYPNKPAILNNLGSSHQLRFERLGEMADIDKAIECKVGAVDLTPDGHPDKPGFLHNLGTSHRTRFMRLSVMVDIAKAIECQVSAVDLTPDGHPDKPSCLDNLGLSHLTRFERLGEMADIGKAIECQVSAVDLTPDGHPNKPSRLDNLGLSHLRRFEHLGEMADIDMAIECQVSAVDLIPNGHPDKPAILNNLGTSHLRQFERLGEMADIDKAIEYQVSSVDLTPDGHLNKPCFLNNLGLSYLGRFGRLGEIADISKAIECQPSQQSRNFSPDAVEYLGEMADIDKAIEYQVLAVDLTPNSHPDKPTYLNNLGTSHQVRFERLSEIADINKAIECQVNAVDLTPDGHPDKPAFLDNLGKSHKTRFEHLGETADIDMAIANFEQCATSVAGPPIVRFRAGRAWILALRLKKQMSNSHSQCLRPQHTLMNLIPELIWLGAPIHQHFQTIQDIIDSSIHEAVSAAIRAQELELAVEWMEQGRSIVWAQLRGLRSPVVDLQGAHPVLAQKFQEVQRKIEMLYLPYDADNTSRPAVGSWEQLGQAHRCNIQKREDLLAEIRNKQGFESFLRPEKYSVLSKACQGCLVILLTVAGEQCDALVILPSRSITHLSFANMSQDVISNLHTRWEKSRMTRLNNRGNEIPALFTENDNLSIQKYTFLEPCLPDRGEHAATLDLEPMSSLLAKLWEKIVHPIVEGTENDLPDLADGRLPHIIWCPSGLLSFLPFHAAGIYCSSSEERIGISDYAVSSYIPSLMALLSNSTTQQLGRPSILIVTQPSTPGQKPLPGTTLEARKIMEKASFYDVQSAIHHLGQSQATVSTVTKQLQTHGWVHLACHGTQNFPDPKESSFALHDGRLTLSSLMQKSMVHAEFAFLSACQTATGDQKIPDEAMHLTSGMLAAGFPNVVGTMWSIEDSVAPEVAEIFYAMLFEEGRKSEWKVRPEPAYALHFALKRLREEGTGDRDLMRWVPSVHYGL
ncbi:CHAT domain-containing protein [Flagelloscypha sp. PMI_526]|nr:CHAT domain-containing protein [Flagelloscypha sp. PMI_526]